MHISILVMELILLAGIFCLMVIIPISRNPEDFVTDYPPEIQDVYYQTHERKKEKLTRTAVLRKSAALIISLFLFTGMARFAGAASYLSAVLTILLYIIWIAAFDTFVIDWIFFPRIRKWRLPGTENMDKAYAQKWFYLKGALKAAPLAVLYALICGLIFILIW